jgi:hypothetical protein
MKRKIALIAVQMDRTAAICQEVDVEEACKGENTGALVYKGTDYENTSYGWMYFGEAKKGNGQKFLANILKTYVEETIEKQQIIAKESQ